MYVLGGSAAKRTYPGALPAFLTEHLPSESFSISAERDKKFVFKWKWPLPHLKEPRRVSINVQCWQESRVDVFDRDDARGITPGLDEGVLRVGEGDSDAF
jgi:hypothetical protein